VRVGKGKPLLVAQRRVARVEKEREFIKEGGRGRPTWPVEGRGGDRVAPLAEEARTQRRKKEFLERSSRFVRLNRCGEEGRAA